MTESGDTLHCKQEIYDVEFLVSGKVVVILICKFCVFGHQIRGYLEISIVTIWRDDIRKQNLHFRFSFFNFFGENGGIHHRPEISSFER